VRLKQTGKKSSNRFQSIIHRAQTASEIEKQKEQTKRNQTKLTTNPYHLQRDIENSIRLHKSIKTIKILFSHLYHPD
jgi:ribosomal protein L9